MAEEVTAKIPQLYRLAYSLIFSRSMLEILQIATETLAKSIQARNAILWQFSAKEGELVPVQSFLEDKTIKTRNVPLGSDYLGEVFRSGKPYFPGADVLKQNKHFQFPKEITPTTGLCVPFKGKSALEGVIEFLSRADGQNFTEEDADFVIKGMELTTVASLNMKSYEEQSRRQLNAITRLTLLYDISQIFNSTLDLTQLLPIICDKIRDILDAESCTIWFMDETGEGLTYGYSSGAYQEAFAEYTAKLDEDPAGEVLRTQEPMLLENTTGDERFQKRFGDESPVYTYMASPLECKGKLLGSLEVLNRVNVESAFNEEDSYLLNDLSHQAAISIHNANLLESERKAKELDALLEISQAITATLNLDKVLLTIVNQAATLIPYDRAAVALVEKNKVELSAVSGKMDLDKKSPDMKRLQNILSWCAGYGKGLYISYFDGKILTDREETREKFKSYFEETGIQSFISIPLKDEEGELGILSFESTIPYFLDERHLEVVSILSNQATVAVRNAQLYRQVPLIDIMQPLMQRKAQFMKMPRQRKIAMGIAAGVLLLVLLLPWKLKILADATIFPDRRIPVVAEVDGIVKQVYLRESDQVNKDIPIASLEDNDYRLALEEQQMQRDVLLRQISRSESLADSGAAGMQKIQLEQIIREIDFSNYRLKKTALVAPRGGIIITPKIEEKVGSLLRKGEVFCELADANSLRAEMFVDESEIEQLEAGQKVRIKMNAFPTKTFQGKVTHLGALVNATDSGRYFRIQAEIENPELLLKPGMVGKAKIEARSHTIGYVLLRKPFRFIWKKLWVWLP